MTHDLYDLSKPVRDAALTEIMRCFAADAKADAKPANPAVIDGHRLGTHMQALCVAYCAERYETFKSGLVADDPIVDIFAVALAQVEAHMAATARPTVGGHPVSPTVSGQAFIRKVALLFFQQLVHIEHGLLDFNIPFERKADGSIGVEAFDLEAMLGKGRGV